MTTASPAARTIFLEAVQYAPQERWEEFVKDRCGTDFELFQQVCRLLIAHQDLGDFHESEQAVTMTTTTETTASIQPGMQIGPYKIREQIGEGGMGEVFVAEQTEPVRRKVALKIIKPGMSTKDVIARFEAERQALAMMNHPNIARVFDGGATESGQPFFVMELVQGVPITQYCDQLKLSTIDRLRLFMKVCRPVQHAHQKGVIHRDLKPTNVLVAEIDGEAVPKVIDFGVAKALNQKLSDQTVYTRFSQMVGTPLYMSPEQAQLGVVDIDTRSDVYSLGVILYELLTGATPIERKVLKQATFDEMRRIIQEVEPPRPSTRVSTLTAQQQSTVSKHRGIGPGKLGGSLRGELDWLVIKAMEKDRNRRYESASALAADIERFLSNEPIEACPPTFRYKLSKIARKNKPLLTTALLIFLALLGGTAIATWNALAAQQAAERAIQAEDVADLARADAEEQARIANQLSFAAQQAANDAQAAEQRATVQRQRAERALYVSDTRLAALFIESGAHSNALRRLIRHDHRGLKEDNRSWEWNYLLARSKRSILSWRASHTNLPNIAWSPDGKQIATVSHDGSACIWDADSGAELHRFSEGRSFKLGASWHPSGNELAWGSTTDDSLVRIWNQSAGSIEKLDAKTPESIWAVAWSHDGRRLAVGCTVKPGVKNLIIWEKIDDQWEISSREEIGATITSVAWSVDDSQLALTCTNGSLYLYETSPLKIRHQSRYFGASRVTWHPQEMQFVYGTTGGDCVIVDAETFTEQLRFEAHTGKLQHAAWSPNHRWLATCGSDGSVKIWDTNDWSLVNSYSGHVGVVNQVEWHADSQKLATVGYDGMVNIWPVQDRQIDFQLENRAGEFAWTADNFIRTVSPPDSVIDRDPRTGVQQRRIRLPVRGKWSLSGPNFVSRIPKDKSPRTVDALAINEQHRIFAERAGAEFDDPEGEGPLTIGVSLHADRFVLQPALSRAVPTLIDFDSNTTRNLGLKHIVSTEEIAWSPNGKIIAAVGRGRQSDGGYLAHAGWLHLYDPQSGDDLAHLQVGSNRIAASSVAWSPDSRRIVAAAQDGLCEMFDAQTQAKLVSSKVHRGRVRTLSWHPDGKRIASGGDDSIVYIWDSRTGETLLSLPVDAKRVTYVEWSPDGKMLAAQTSSKVILVWDATDGYAFSESAEFQARIARRCEEEFHAAVAIRDFTTAKESLLEFLVTTKDATIQTHYPFLTYYELGLLCVADGDQVGYSNVCQQMLRQFADSEHSQETHFAAWTCALAPRALDDYEPAIKLARQAVDQEQSNQQYFAGLGAILLRAGQYKEAKEQLKKALEAGEDDNTSPSYIHYFLAMTEHHLGDSEVAQEHLSAANESTEKELVDKPPWNRKLTLELLRSEAEALIITNTGNTSEPENNK